MKPYFINECSTLGKHGKFYVIVPATGPVRAFHASVIECMCRNRKDEVMKAIGDLAENYFGDEEEDDDV